MFQEQITVEVQEWGPPRGDRQYSPMWSTVDELIDQLKHLRTAFSAMFSLGRSDASLLISTNNSRFIATMFCPEDIVYDFIGSEDAGDVNIVIGGQETPWPKTFLVPFEDVVAIVRWFVSTPQVVVDGRWKRQD